MAKYRCAVCGWEYDEATGFPNEGIKPGTKWEDIRLQAESGSKLLPLLYAGG